MAQFRKVEGTSVVVSPLKGEFTTDEDVIIQVSCSVERLGWAAEWGTRMAVYNAPGGEFLRESTSRHSAVGFGEFIDREDDVNYRINMGRLQPGSYGFTVVIAGNDWA